MQTTTWETQTAWKVARTDPEKARALAQEAGVSELTARLLLGRGVATADDARAFLRPSLKALSDPETLPGIGDAAEIVRDAVRADQRIVVYGDYDVDGISGTALLVTFLRACRATVSPYIPEREREGYGLNGDAVRRIAQGGAQLLITVDHGTTAVKEIALARELGLTVIVLDHHIPGDELPAANAIVNPHLAENYGAHPCGVGVAFKFAWALARSLAGGPRVAETHKNLLSELLGFAALGTISDVVPLRDENRIIAHFGLQMLGRSRRAGVRALLDVSRVGPDGPTVRDVAYGLAPRLNAAGRLGSAITSLELLLTEDPEEARRIAAHLDRENRRRREIEAAIVAQARERVETTYEPGFPGGIAMGDPEWHGGVVGIVAARIAESYYRPVALAAFSGDLGRGSCRTIPGVALPPILSRCSEHLETWGGHAAAAGFTVRAGNFEAFRTAFEQAAADLMAPEDLVRHVLVDAVVPLHASTPAFVRELDRLEPFGEGNPQPVLATRGVRVAGRPRRLGKKGQHLSFLVSDGSSTFRAIGFGMGEMEKTVEKAGADLDIAYTPRADTWRNDGSLELSLVDVSPGSDGRVHN